MSEITYIHIEGNEFNVFGHPKGIKTEVCPANASGNCMARLTYSGECKHNICKVSQIIVNIRDD